MSKNVTIIYKDTTLDNTGFVIAVIEEKTSGTFLRQLDEDHPIYSKEEQAQILLELGDTEENRRLVESDYIIDNTDLLNILINKHNDNLKIETHTSYYSCYLKINRKPLIELISDEKLIKEEIDIGRYKEIARKDNAISKEEIILEINNYKERNDDLYYVSLCPKCGGYHIFNAKNGSVEGECQTCHQILNFLDSTFIYKGRNYTLASLKAKEQNSGLSIENTSVIFRYNGMPFYPFDSNELFALIYRNKSADAVFKVIDNIIYFKDSFIKYISMIDSRGSKRIISELERIQSDLPDSINFDIYAALFWLYHNFEPAKRSNRSDEKNVITSLGVFYNRNDFINKFLTSNLKDRQYLLTLLHPIYIELFLDVDGEYFTSDNRYLDFAKLVYALTKKYIYVSSDLTEIDVYGSNWINYLLVRDEYTFKKSLLINFISKDLKSFLPSDKKNTYFKYDSKLSDGYDLNCYFYSFYLDDGYYRYLDLVLPIDANEMLIYLNKVVENAYLYNDKKTLDLIFYLLKENLLSGSRLLNLNTLLNNKLGKYLTDKNVFELYLLLKKGEPLNKVKIIYKDYAYSVFEHARKAVEENKLSELAKDKNINLALSTLLKDKDEVIQKAKALYNELNETIDKLMEGY